MPASLLESFAQTVSNGLKRKSIIDCYNWATKCRVMGTPFSGPYSDKYFPWAREMHNCNENWCCKKGAQLGITEIALNRAFFTIDILRVHVLYLLPSQTPDASEFSAGRFNPALEESPYLADLFSDVQNVSHKRAGGTNLYLRGTRSRSQLKSIPAGLIVFDELDEMVQKNLSLAEERQSGQLHPQSIKLSTPTVSGTGISKEYKMSSQEHFFFSCPCCSRMTELVYPDCLVIVGEDFYDPRIMESHLICKECKGILPHETKFEWLHRKPEFVKSTNSFQSRGFHVNGLYSSAALRHPGEIAKKALKAKTDPDVEQEFHNSVLGHEHEVAGSRVQSEDIEACKLSDLKLNPLINNQCLITLGIDQGKDLHVEVNHWLPTSASNDPTVDINNRLKPRLVSLKIMRNFPDIDKMIQAWKPRAVVIDANPETRLALELAARWPGLVWLCYYGEGIKSRNVQVWSNEPKITVDRTSWLDLSLGRFHNHSIGLPYNLPTEYVDQIKAPIRRPDTDKSGNPIARYFTAERVADHFAHARNYAEIALQFATSSAPNETIGSPR